jgi:murein DD-endopeptidase MepM/ murein hydrolase activator NlpD
MMAEKADFWVHMLRERIQDQVVLLACTPSILPVEGLMTHGYSWRHDPFTGRRAFHRGLDISAARGTPIVAAADGVVTAAGWNGSYGRTIDVNHGYGVTTRYGHLRKVLVQSGDWVRKGELIGEVGSSGRATGPHLHYEVLENGRPVNPIPRYVLDEPDLASRK